MKHLTISLKTTDEVLKDFKKAFKLIRKRKTPPPHYEISFDNKKDFDRFLSHLPILKYVLIFKPKSVYELAKIAHMDVSNLNKVILFLEEVGALKVRSEIISGRTVKRPVVDYDTVEFNLAA